MATECETLISSLVAVWDLCSVDLTPSKVQVAVGPSLLQKAQGWAVFLVQLGTSQWLEGSGQLGPQTPTAAASPYGVIRPEFRAGTFRFEQRQLPLWGSGSELWS